MPTVEGARSARALGKIAHAVTRATPGLLFLPAGEYVTGFDASGVPLTRHLSENALVTGGILGNLSYQPLASLVGLSVPLRQFGDSLQVDLRTDLGLVTGFAEAMNILSWDPRIHWQLANATECALQAQARADRVHFGRADASVDRWLQPDGFLNLQVGPPGPSLMCFRPLIASGEEGRRQIDEALLHDRRIWAWRNRHETNRYAHEQGTLYYVDNADARYPIPSEIFVRLFCSLIPGGGLGRSTDLFGPSVGPDDRLDFKLAATIDDPQAIAPYRLDRFDGPA